MKKNKRIWYIAALLWVVGISAFAQSGTSRQGSSTDTSSGASSMAAAQNAMLARSNPEYRVTAGDVYTLAYAIGASQITYIITVDSSYRIRVSNLGFVDGTGKTFLQVKREVEAVVINNYPLSGVQLVLTQPAVFQVHVKGEVAMAGEVSAWALSRLSSLVDINPLAGIDRNAQVNTQNNTQTFNGFLTALASLRDVTIQSLNGQTRVYDLFKAQRLGDRDQDPYLRPGDIVTFNQIKRIVTINGAVERPGTYQLLDDENVKELIEYYGGGFTPIADVTRLEMVRLVNSADIAGDKIFLTENDLANNYPLENYDRITIPIITQLQPVMFVEGAIADMRQSLNDMGISTSGNAEDLVASNRLVVQFNKGETYASLVRKNINWFTSVSDTQNAYILRNDEQILMNLNPMLYDASYRGEVFIMENDTLVIPFRQYFVTVAGAVVRPGRYPYIPDRDWEYYIALAGGFIPERNSRQSITITDIEGKRMKKTDAIGPETVITARTNHFLYGFNQVAPVVTTVLSVVTTFLSIWAITNSK